MWAVGAIMAELYTLRPLFPGQSEIDQLFRVCAVLGAPTNNATNTSSTNTSSASTSSTNASSTAPNTNHTHSSSTTVGDPNEWSDGYTLSGKMSFKFPPCSATPLDQLVTGASASALELIAWMLRWDPGKRPSAEAAIAHRYFISSRAAATANIAPSTTNYPTTATATTSMLLEKQLSRRGLPSIVNFPLDVSATAAIQPVAAAATTTSFGFKLPSASTFANGTSAASTMTTGSTTTTSGKKLTNVDDDLGAFFREMAVKPGGVLPPPFVGGRKESLTEQQQQQLRKTSHSNLDSFLGGKWFSNSNSANSHQHHLVDTNTSKPAGSWDPYRHGGPAISPTRKSSLADDLNVLSSLTAMTTTNNNNNKTTPPVKKHIPFFLQHSFSSTTANTSKPTTDVTASFATASTTNQDKKLGKLDSFAWLQGTTFKRHGGGMAGGAGGASASASASASSTAAPPVMGRRVSRNAIANDDPLPMASIQESSGMGMVGPMSIPNGNNGYNGNNNSNSNTINNHRRTSKERIGGGGGAMDALYDSDLADLLKQIDADLGKGTNNATKKTQPPPTRTSQSKLFDGGNMMTRTMDGGNGIVPSPSRAPTSSSSAAAATAAVSGRRGVPIATKDESAFGVISSSSSSSASVKKSPERGNSSGGFLGFTLSRRSPVKETPTTGFPIATTTTTSKITTTSAMEDPSGTTRGRSTSIKLPWLKSS